MRVPPIDLAVAGRLARRMLAPAAFLAGVAIRGGGSAAWLGGQRADAQALRAALESERLSLVRQTRSLERRIALVDAGLPSYRALVADGLIGAPDPIVASTRLEEQAVADDINALGYRFEPMRRLALPDGPDRAPAAALNVPVEVTLDSLFETDVFAFLDAVPDILPGHVSVRRLALSRGETAIDSAVSDLLRGDRPDLVRATAVIDWTRLAIGDDTDPAADPAGQEATR